MTNIYLRKRKTWYATLIIMLSLLCGNALAQERYVVSATKLSVKKTASAEASTIGNLSKGTEVDVYGFNGGWAEIRFGDMPAFIPKKLIEKATPVVPQPPKSPTSNALTQKQQQKDEPKTNMPEKLILKKKKEHSDDGYRWYEYVYNNKGNGKTKTLRAAFDENERQITPILESDNLSYTNGFFEFDTDEGHALYDKQGKCVIPSSLGFNIIWIHPDEGKVVAYNSNRAEETKRTFSFDGKPCADLASKTNNQQTTSNEDEDFEDYYEHVREGNEHLADCDYKAAARSYKKALKYQKDANVLFNLGVAQYNDGKYQRASKSFDEAYTMLRSQKGNSDLAERALQMKRLSANAASEKSQRVWGTVALVSSTVLAATAVAVAETELQKQGISPSVSNDPLYPSYMEYMDYVNKGMLPYLTFEEYKKGYYRAAQNDFKVTPSPNPAPTPGPRTKDCPICHHSGKCNNCNGKGHHLVLGTDTRCTNCNGTGRCPYCGGARTVTSH